MGVNKLFSKDTNYISRKRMRENYQHDPIFHKMIMSDPQIANILDKPGEQKRFHELLKEKARDGKVDIHDMRKIAEELASGKVEGISGKEGHSIARAFFPDSSRRYEHEDPKPQKASNRQSTETNHDSQKQAGSSEKINSQSPQSFLAIRTHTATSLEKESKTKKSSFFSALRSTLRSRNKP